MKFHFFERQAENSCPAGWTVSKNPKLPDGDFRIVEYSWLNDSLWFVGEDNFTADERQAAYMAFLQKESQ